MFVFPGIASEKDRDELLIESTPVVWQFVREILVHTEVRANVVAAEALLGIDTLRPAQPDSKPS
jgi:hypothetical protein